MAIDLISENNNLPTSPRISFSYDLCPKDTSLPSIQHHSHNSSHSDFNFSTTLNPPETSSSADELFSGGLIRPIPLPVSSSKSSLPPLPKTPSKPPCHIRRSSSLHCENTHKKTPFWPSFPLLSRSFSTGSLRKGKKQNSETTTKQQRSSATFYTFPSSSPARRNGEGVRVNPVINILPHHVSANLFRFGSLFRNRKENNKKISLPFCRNT
nr:uncharacterized protein LOC109172229 [Ipomoea trifida]